MLHDTTLDDLFAHSRNRADRLKCWLQRLRADDPQFAEASALYPDDMGEWHAAVHLLTACAEVWHALRDHALATTSVAHVIEELARPGRAWSSSEEGVMQWAAHFWDVGRWPAKFPYVFGEYYFQRWIAACHLYKRVPPLDSRNGALR